MDETVVPVVDLQMGNTSVWHALNTARRSGYVSSVSDWWSSNVALSEQRLPEGARMLWEESRPEAHEVVIELPDAVLMVSKERRDVRCTAYAGCAATAAAHILSLRALLPTAPRQSKLLDVTFWYSTAHGARSYDRQLQAPTFTEIEVNYPATTREKLKCLKTVKPTEGGGKLLLWQGEPGTGKTFALRALAEEWADWCKVHYVLDPEKFFTEGDYLLRVILGEDIPAPVGRTSTLPQWRLIVLEDAGEMLAPDAKSQVGQGLGRLLNLCDGLLGQGLRVLVLITTNEQVGSLHAAVSRPGRCLAQVSFEKFDQRQANEWLKAHESNTAVTKSSTLADLYALLDGGVAAPARAAGFR